MRLLTLVLSQRAAATVILKLPDLHADALSRLYTLKTFQAKLGSLCLPGVTLSLRDCAVLAKYLSMKQLCVVQGEVSVYLRWEPTAWLLKPSVQVIKFAPPLSSSAQSLTITESDRGILTLTATLSSLETYIASIEARIAAEQAQAVSYNAKKQLTLVKSHIIARKRLESLLEQRVASKDKLSEVLHGIEKATGDEEVGGNRADRGAIVDTAYVPSDNVGHHARHQDFAHAHLVPVTLPRPHRRDDECSFRRSCRRKRH